jgi:hypothetical protein
VTPFREYIHVFLFLASIAIYLKWQLGGKAATENRKNPRLRRWIPVFAYILTAMVLFATAIIDQRYFGTLFPILLLMIGLTVLAGILFHRKS